MSSQQRIQLRRTKGWRKPPGCVVVARPTRHGNPFRVGDGVTVTHHPQGAALDDPGVTYGWLDVDQELAVALFRAEWDQRLLVIENDPDLAGDWIEQLDALVGMDVACWCAVDEPCHGDVLLELADWWSQNRPPEQEEGPDEPT